MTEPKSNSNPDIHQLVLRGDSKEEVEDKISDFFVQHAEEVEVINIKFQWHEAIIEYKEVSEKKC